MSLSPLQWAEAYHRRGLRPLPAAPKTKFPRVPWLPFQDTAPTLDQLRAWWGETPDAGIALVLGQSSQVIVVDLDGGEAAERLLTERGITLPAAAPRVRTRHGWHVYLRCTHPVADRIALFSSDVPKAQVDVRGQGIIMAPPSMHPTGVPYEWETPLPPHDDTPLPVAPARLLDLLQAPPTPRHGVVVSDPTADSWVTTALRQGAPEGQRNITCARLAGYLLGKGLPPDVVETMLLDFARRCVPMLPDREVTRAVQSVSRRAQMATDTPATVATAATHVAAILRDVEEAYADGPVAFLDTPLPDLNVCLEGGFAPGELIYLGGRPGTGKSALALGIAKHAAERGTSVLVANVEMKNRMSAQRLLAQDSRVPAGVIKRGTFSTDQWTAFQAAVQRLSRLPLWFTDESYTLEQIAAIAGQATDLGLIVVDYLQLLKASPGTRERRHQVEELSKGLQRLAHTHTVPVLALSSLSRPAHGSRPSLASLRESGELEHDADTVLLLHREEDDQTGRTELIVAKARSGRVGTIDLFFHGETQTFAEAVM